MNKLILFIITAIVIMLLLTMFPRVEKTRVVFNNAREAKEFLQEILDDYQTAKSKQGENITFVTSEK